MALYAKGSNSLDTLSQELAKNLSELEAGVFEPYLLVTQTEGMNNWLKQQLANRLGIAANYRFLKPNDLIYRLYTLLGGEHAEVLSAHSLSWVLFNLLGEKAFAEKYPDVAGYYLDSGADGDRKRMALAERVADLFDQYQVYRPGMVRQWNDLWKAGAAAEEWQQYLWGQAKQLLQDALPDKTVMGQYIMGALEKPDQQQYLAARMKSVHLFGISIITAYHIEILFRLSEFTHVYFYLLNPAPGVYWFDDKTEKQLARWRHLGLPVLETEAAGNALLVNWGRVVKDTFGFLLEHDMFLNAYDDSEVVQPERDSLLHKIQYDIFRAAGGEARESITEADINDGSLSIHSCFTVAREVEVLYNYLVHLLDQKKEILAPRDIVVMVSNVDMYAPYIKAVFNNAPYRFRYTIADESYAENDNLYHALQAVMQIEGDSFKAEEVLQLLDFSYIRRRFSIENLSLIRNVVDSANIRYGMEGRKEDETFVVSWQYGLKRIMFGICMSGGERYDEEEDLLYPLDRVEGSDAWEMIRFCHFVDKLMEVVEARESLRTIAEWVGYVEAAMHCLVYEPEEEINEDYSAVIQQLSDFAVLNTYMTEEVAFDVFRYSLLQSLNATTRSGLFVNGGITFCSLIPMRSIPFKVVALLGLSYDRFPRREPALGFNLMDGNRQRGDRSVKENDKHLFLETILSAQKYLYISYVGQHAKDNSVIPASALVDELVLKQIIRQCANFLPFVQQLSL